MPFDAFRLGYPKTKGLIQVKLIRWQASKENAQPNKIKSEDSLRLWSAMPQNELLDRLGSSPSGLSSKRAERLFDEYGENIITSGDKNPTLRRLRDAIANPFNAVLIAIAVISYFTDVIASSRPDYFTIIVILALVSISSLVAFVQNQRSGVAAEKLSRMISSKADVMRDDSPLEIDISRLVPGDVVQLRAGDMIPADVRFLNTKDTFVAQAALTGESAHVEKFSSPPANKNIAITDCQNLGFMGTNIISGSSLAVVLATGNDTYFGSMAKTLSGDKAKNSFERGIDSVSWLLIRMMAIMVPVILIINGFSKGDWGRAVLFAISVAVGLTPEMLPVIMTSTLAKGAVTMSRHKVIVKTLGAIQTFGEMDVLCTDKTGTLTEDKIVLEKYMNLHGDDDKRVLRHAYLNSYFQTGLKNLIDIAIIERAAVYRLDSVAKEYTRIDEIPFDFTRRRMSVVLEDSSGKRQLITKGAVEEILSISSFIEIEGRVVPLSSETRRTAMDTYEKHNNSGLRMLAVAQKNDVPAAGDFGVADERDMVVIGFVAFLDPPKESAKAAISSLHRHGVRTVVLTGDSEGVALKVCKKVGVDTALSLLGSDVDAMNDKELIEAVKSCNLFSKLTPSQKQRVVKAFQDAGHTVGYMGDGINDSPALHQSDVGISVDSAVDIAKETADIILLQKDLLVLEEGVKEGRRTFGNIVKYIKMAASGNFGNMISVMAASIFLPFLPMLPVQLLTQNLLCDFSQMGIPFDSVDKEYIEKPRKWDTKSIKSFMVFMGPLSSIFDMLCFAVMWWAVGANSVAMAPVFHSGWFLFGTISQILVIHIIRTAKTPFIKSSPSLPLKLSTFSLAVAAAVLGFSRLAEGLDMARMPLSSIPWLAALIAAYLIAAQIAKKLYIRRFKEWI
ncbi:MAG: magnesium-translocating P-type ATPase [Christensenellales bacterium]